MMEAKKYYNDAIEERMPENKIRRDIDNKGEYSILHNIHYSTLTIFLVSIILIALGIISMRHFHCVLFKYLTITMKYKWVLAKNF